ncbi:hemolysin III family protein [Marinicella sp. S1101]|uniref:PAQR family membrane homeostasis protein TrhA n=1 Tax=Marinicella marina TaxID=2996016 RepID=UPI0022609224|nr:hemolysin III family protein [Marinicella marina]MCX7552894.1 hemolysin III family protein [Marinicella marina]MDJ1139797.1 hemolysin III family protein [Marinicella marina]
MSTKPVKFYPANEERINILSHALGLGLSVLGLIILTLKGIQSSQWQTIVAYAVYGISMVLLFAASTFYHLAKLPAVRARMRVLDHAAIYVLIAGTYTPFMLLTIPGPLGYGILIAAWSMAVIGITIKLFYTGHFELLSTLLYLFMGWAIVFAIKPLAAKLSAEGLQWLILGGAAYTVGAILYAIKKIPYNHAIFHLFVLLGSCSHFIAIYCFI